MTDNPTALQLVTDTSPTTLGDLARYAAGIEVITDVIKARREVVRDQLHRELAAAAEAEGVDGATRKITGLGSVTLSAPEPHVKVTDADELGAWLADGLPLGEQLQPHLDSYTEVRPGAEPELAELAELADVLPPIGRTKAQLWEHLTRLQQLAAMALRSGQRWLLPDKAAELIEKHPEVKLIEPVDEPVEGSSRPIIHPGYAVHLGERIPGCQVVMARPTVSVKIDKAARQAEGARVTEALGW